MIDCATHENKSKVILLKSGHYRRIVDLTDDDIENFLSLENKILSFFTNPLDKICCIKHNETNDDNTHDCGTNEDDLSAEYKIVDVEQIEICTEANLDDKTGLTESDNLNEVNEPYDYETGTKDIEKINNDKLLKTILTKTKMDLIIEKKDSINIDYGVKALFYISSKDHPIEVIAKMNIEKEILIIERKYMARFFPIKLMTKLVTEVYELEEYKGDTFKNKDNLENCIVIHAKNFNKPIGVEFHNKNVKQKFMSNLSLTRYYRTSICPTRQ